MPKKAPTEDLHNKITNGHNIFMVKEIKSKYVGTPASYTPKVISHGNLLHNNNQSRVIKEIREISLELNDHLTLNNMLLSMELLPNFNKISLEIKDKIKHSINEILKTHISSKPTLKKIIIRSNFKDNIKVVGKGYTFSNKGELLVNIDSIMLIDNDNNISLSSPSLVIPKRLFGRHVGKENFTSFLRSNEIKIPPIDLNRKAPIQKVFRENDDTNKLLERHKEKIRRHRIISFREISEKFKSESEIDNDEIEIVPTSLEHHKPKIFKISSELAAIIKKSLTDDSQLNKLSEDEVHKLFQKTFFTSLGFYQSLMVRKGEKKYYVYKDYEFDVDIDILITKEFPIKISSRSNIYEELYKELYTFLQYGDIRIGEFGKLLIEKYNIIIKVTEDLQSLDKIVPVKSKKLRFK